MFLLEIDEETIYACANMEAYLSRIEERISFELNYHCATKPTRNMIA